MFSLSLRLINAILITVILTAPLAACGKKEEAQGPEIAAAVEQPEEKSVQNSEKSEGTASDREYLEKYGNEIILTAKSALDGYCEDVSGIMESLTEKTD